MEKLYTLIFFSTQIYQCIQLSEKRTKCTLLPCFCTVLQMCPLCLSSWPSRANSLDQAQRWPPDRPGESERGEQGTINTHFTIMPPSERYCLSPHLQTVSMYEGLRHSFTPDVDVLDLLWSDVFSLSQLENVLLTVHELQSAILQ